MPAAIEVRGQSIFTLDLTPDLTDHYHEAPVWIVACLIDGENPDRVAGASIYGAVQNMCLTIRCARPRYDADDAPYRLRQRGRCNLRVAVERAFLLQSCRSAGQWAILARLVAARSRISFMAISGASPTRGL